MSQSAGFDQINVTAYPARILRALCLHISVISISLTLSDTALALPFIFYLVFSHFFCGVI